MQEAVEETREGPVRRSWTRNPLLYALLLPLYPVFYLWASNLDDQIPASSVVPIVLGVLAGSALIWAIARVLLRDAHRAAFASTAVALLFLSFGHLLNAVDPYGGRGLARPLLLLFGVLAACGVVVAARAPWIPKITAGLNLVALVLVGINVVPIVANAADPPPQPAGAQVDLGDASIDATGSPRDVYYLIFDRYGRDDVLREQYDFDNAAFLQQLEDRGFVLVEGSTANYPRTTHSLASSLNMTYLDGLAEDVGYESDDLDPLYGSLDGGSVPAAFQQLGYDYVHIGSWWEPTAEDPTADVNEVFDPIDEFNFVFWQTTMWPSLSRLTGIGDPDARLREAWARNLEQLQAIGDVADDPRPTFTFAHLMLPHPPYVSAPDGSYAPPGSYPDIDASYLAQLQATNGYILDLLDRLLAVPEAASPIIVVQSDEGPNPDGLEADQNSYDFFAASQDDVERKLRILDAVYLPGEPGQEPLPPTPVNTFRAILSRYYGADLPLLPDRVFVYKDAGHPYEFRDITEQMELPAR